MHLRANSLGMLVLICLVGCDHKLDTSTQYIQTYRLVYNNGSNGGITIITVDGTNKRILERGILPKWSPREDKIAFLGGGPGFLLLTMHSDGSQRFPVSEAIVPNSGGVLWQDWSPDGKRLVFFTNKYFVSGTFAVVNADGTNEKNLTPEGFWRVAEWSPDGSKIAVEGAPAGQPPTIYIFNPEGTEMYPLVNAFAITPLWAPDGKRIAFQIITVQDSSKRLFKFDSYLCLADGSNLRALNDDGNHHIRAWSPDGSRFLYNFKPDHVTDPLNKSLGVIAVDGSWQKTLIDVDDYHSIAVPTFSPDGSKIAYLRLSRVTTEERIGLWVMNADGTGAIKVDIDETSEMLEYDWSPK